MKGKQMKRFIPNDPVGRKLAILLAALSAFAVFALVAEPFANWMRTTLTYLLTPASEASAQRMRIGYHLLCGAIGVCVLFACRRRQLSTGKPFSNAGACRMLAVAAVFSALFLCNETVLLAPAAWQMVVLRMVLLVPFMVAASSALLHLLHVLSSDGEEGTTYLSLACIASLLIALPAIVEQTGKPLLAVSGVASQSGWGPGLLALAATQMLSVAVSCYVWGPHLNAKPSTPTGTATD